jgi:hypothetical protein
VRSVCNDYRHRPTEPQLKRPPAMGSVQLTEIDSVKQRSELLLVEVGQSGAAKGAASRYARSRLRSSEGMFVLFE